MKQNHLYYRRSMKGLAMIDLQRAYGKKITKDNLIKVDPHHLNNLIDD